MNLQPALREIALNNTIFLQACQRKETEYTPIWLMRQAGRYMKEYRSIREKLSFLDMCKTPEVAAEVTLQPVERLGVDAAIIFSDILVPLEPMGIHLEYTRGEGPIIHNPIRSQQNIEDLRIIEPQTDVPFVLEAVTRVRQSLHNRVPLIGFAGAPFTLASYIIESGYARNFVNTKKLMYQMPQSWHLLMGKLAEVTVRYLNAQIDAGAQAVQLFDSWVGCLSLGDYAEFVLPHTRHIFQHLRADVPAIHFATGSATLLELMRQAGGDIIGVDWRIELGTAWQNIGYDVGIQGNLDPVVLFAPSSTMKNAVKRILDGAANRPGHIFNLGHGILPETPVENVVALVDMVHELSHR